MFFGAGQNYLANNSTNLGSPFHGTATYTAGIAPDGTNTAIKLCDDAVYTTHIFYPYNGTASNAPLESVYVKAVAGSAIAYVGLFPRDAVAYGAIFNLATCQRTYIYPGGAAWVAIATGALITDGWCRIWVKTGPTIASDNMEFGPAASPGTVLLNMTYAGDGTGCVYFWRPQVELGVSYPSPPQVTAGASMTWPAASASAANPYSGQTLSSVSLAARVTDYFGGAWSGSTYSLMVGSGPIGNSNSANMFTYPAATAYLDYNGPVTNDTHRAQSSVAALTSGVEHTFLGTFNGTQSTLIIDGATPAQTRQDIGGPPVQAATVNIGAYGTYSFNGAFKRVMVCKTATPTRCSP